MANRSPDMFVRPALMIVPKRVLLARWPVEGQAVVVRGGAFADIREAGAVAQRYTDRDPDALRGVLMMPEFIDAHNPDSDLRESARVWRANGDFPSHLDSARRRPRRGACLCTGKGSRARIAAPLTVGKTGLSFSRIVPIPIEVFSLPQGDLEVDKPFPRSVYRRPSLLRLLCMPLLISA
jgi:hypothetical protein